MSMVEAAGMSEGAIKMQQTMKGMAGRRRLCELFHCSIGSLPLGQNCSEWSLQNQKRQPSWNMYP